MSLVRVFDNVYLNPSAVGKVEFKVAYSENRRTSITTVYDVTGQHTLLTAKTEVSTSLSAYDSDPDAVRRDNHVHHEIVAALNEGRDARQWTTPMPSGIVIRITGHERQHDSFCEDSQRVVADAYSFEMVKGDMSAAMALIEARSFDWLAHAVPTGSEGWFMLFELPSEYNIRLGMEFDMSIGPSS